MIRARNLQVRGILKSISADLDRGQMVGLLGRNGSGKTTLLRALWGMQEHRAIQGEIELQGKKIQEWPVNELSRMVNYLGSDLSISFPLTVREYLKQGLSHGVLLEPIAQKCQIDALLERDLRNLSGGEKQRTLLAGALCRRVQVLFLDETFSKQDPHHRQALADLLRAECAQGLSVIWVDHDLNFLAEWSDDLWVLENGEISLKGKPKDVYNENLLRRMFPNVRWNESSGTSRRFFPSR